MNLLPSTSAQVPSDSIIKVSELEAPMSEWYVWIYFFSTLLKVGIYERHSISLGSIHDPSPPLSNDSISPPPQTSDDDL